MLCDESLKINTPSFLEGLVGHKLRHFKKRRHGKTESSAEGQTKYRRPTVLFLGKQRLLSRVVAEHIVGRALTCNDLVHHKDGNPFNNLPDNLEVVTRSSHKRIHDEIGIKTRFKKKWKINESVVMRLHKAKTCEHIAGMFGCSGKTISRIVKKHNGNIPLKRGPRK